MLNHCQVLATLLNDNFVLGFGKHTFEILKSFVNVAPTFVM